MHPSVSMSQWSGVGDRLTCLSDCVIITRSHVVRFTAQIPVLHSAKYQAGKSVEQDKTPKIVVITLDTPDIQRPVYVTTIVADSARPSPTTMLTWLWLWWWHRYHVTATKQCSREVRGLTTRWFLSYRRVRLLMTITWCVILMICQWKLAKVQNWKLVWKPYNQSDVHGNRQ